MATSLDWLITKCFSDKSYPCFSTEDAYMEFPDKHQSHVKKTLSKMVSDGKLIRLNKGLYHIVPLDQNPEHFLPNWHLVADYLMKGKEYYIGYYAALQIHQLITQPSLKEIIVTSTQIKPSVIEIQGVQFQFVYHNHKRFTGFEKMWINNHDKVMCSDLEKTLVDCLVNPAYSQGIIEIAKAIYQARDKINTGKIFNYFSNAGNKAALKRYLFLCTQFEIGNNDSHYVGMKRIMDESVWDDIDIGNSISLLDPTAPDEGKIDTHFKLKINRDVETIRQSIHT